MAKFENAYPSHIHTMAQRNRRHFRRAFNVLATTSDDESVDTVGTQIVALMAHGQLTANTAATTSQQLAQLQMAQQQMMSQLAAMLVTNTPTQIMAPAMSPSIIPHQMVHMQQPPLTQGFQYNNASSFGSRFGRRGGG